MRVHEIIWIEKQANYICLSIISCTFLGSRLCSTDKQASTHYICPDLS